MKTYLTTKELSEKLKVSQVTIFNWRKKGLPLAIETPPRFDAEAVIKWLNEQNKRGK